MILAIILLSGAVSILAQNGIPRPPEEPAIEGPAREGPDREVDGKRESDRERESGSSIIGNAHINASPEVFLASRHRERPEFLQWEETRDASGKPSWTAQTARSTRVDLSTLEQSLKAGTIIVNNGDLPRGKVWLDLNTRYANQIITHEPESANRDPQAIRQAYELGNRALDPATVKVFNALPQEAGMEHHLQEQSRMQIGGTLEYWKKLNQDIKAESGAVLPARATKKAFLDELRYGKSNVVMLYGHYDGERLYMPGAKGGGSISIDEIAKIDRTRDADVRNRVIILVACRAGARTLENPRSLTSVLLKNGIARSVMATERPYDSAEIPALLHRLASGALVRDAGGQMQNRGQLQQFVDLDVPEQSCGRDERPQDPRSIHQFLRFWARSRAV